MSGDDGGFVLVTVSVCLLASKEQNAVEHQRLTDDMLHSLETGLTPDPVCLYSVVAVNVPTPCTPLRRGRKHWSQSLFRVVQL